MLNTLHLSRTPGDSLQGADTLVAAPADSLVRIVPTPPVKTSPAVVNLFGAHSLKPVHNGPVDRPNVSPDWLFPVLILVAAVFTWLRVFYNKYFSQLFEAVVNNNLTNQIVRDENILVQRASVYLSIVFYLVAALFLYEFSLYRGWELADIGSGFPRFLFFAILVSAVYALKFLVLKIAGWLFDLERETALYIFNVFLLNNLLGILLLPLIALLAFHSILPADRLFQAALIIVGLLYVYRLFRGLLVGLGTSGFSPLYLFLYLCTLEIAPLLVLLRLVDQG
jgi:hypothetical protein